jgi:hypothetical protein
MATNAKSLLDLSLERLEAAGQTLETRTRMTLVGRLAPTAAADAFGMLCKEQFGGEGQVTGLLLMMPNGWVQTIEGASSDLLAFVAALQAQLATGTQAEEKGRDRRGAKGKADAIAAQKGARAALEGVRAQRAEEARLMREKRRAIESRFEEVHIEKHVGKKTVHEQTRVTKFVPHELAEKMKDPADAA